MARAEQRESLKDEIEQTLEEARMVLPGIQALFGFQLIAVFNQRFGQELTDFQKRLHLGAVLLTVVAIGLIMAPAAYHRYAERDRISRYFANYASTLITLAMVPLALALSIEVTLVCALVTGDTTLSSMVGTGQLLFLAWVWFMFPAYKKKTRVGGTGTTHAAKHD